MARNRFNGLLGGVATLAVTMTGVCQGGCGDGAAQGAAGGGSSGGNGSSGSDAASGDSAGYGDARPAVDGSGGLDASRGNSDAAPTSLPLLQSSDLKYLGAFRVPQGASGTDPDGFSYGGGFAASTIYRDPAHGGAPTIFLSGYLSAGYVSSTPSLAQISIPALADPNAVGLGGLNTATLLQPFANPTGGHDPLNGNGFCGYAIQASSLLGFCAVSYDASGS